METRGGKGFKEIIKKKKTPYSFLLHLLIHQKQYIKVTSVSIPASDVIKPKASLHCGNL